jgi:dienelactone hydrolase
MAAALAKFLEKTPYDHLVFIGYSGGGTLAVLLAEQFEQTLGVLTVAGNLDPPQWAAWHGYSPLHGSANPANGPSLSPTVMQMHLVGGKDTNVPVNLVRQFIEKQIDAKIIVYRDYNHVCCWEASWPVILARWQASIEK